MPRSPDDAGVIATSPNLFVTALALAACSVIMGCRPGPVEADAEPPVAAHVDSQPADSQPADSQPTPTPDETPPPEPAQPFEITYFVDRQLWQIDPDGTNARALGYEVPDDAHFGSGRIGDGTHEPTVSRDGRWLACLTGTNVLVVELTGEGQGPRVHPITRLPPPKNERLVAANVSYSEWSPDSSTLLVLLDEPSYLEDDPLPLPPGTHYGFHVLRTDDLQLEHAPHIENYLGWMPDSQAVIDSKYIAHRDYELLAYPIAPGPAKLLQRSNDPYGHSQLSVMGDQMAWTAHGDGSTSQIVVAPISPITPSTGNDPRPLSPRAKFAEIQWPMLSPTGKRAVFAQQSKLMLGEGDGTPVKWPSHSEFQWWDDEHVVTVTKAGLVMMDLQGQARVLDPAGTGLVHH